LFGFDMADMAPPFRHLAVHLANGQRVYFTDTEEAVRAAQVHAPDITLTAWLEWNRQHSHQPQHHHLYYDMPQQCVWNAHQKMWIARARRRRSAEHDAIGRVYTVHAIAGVLFYIRMLVHHPSSKGKVSFLGLRSINGECHGTFRAACEACGVVGDDREWDGAMVDAVQMHGALRQLFATLLAACEVGLPTELLHNFWEAMSEDFVQSLRRVSMLNSEVLIFCSTGKYYYIYPF
jgi:hypothetical protein